MRTPLTVLAVSATVVAATLGAPSAASAAGDSLAVSFDVGQTLPQIDPHTAAVHVTVRSTDCSTGCELYKVGRLRFNESEELLASWTYAAQSTPRATTISDVLNRNPGWSLSYTYELRSGGGGGGAVRAYADADAVVYDETAATYTGPWQRDANIGTTETLIERSATAGATATLPAQAQLRRVGVISARGPRNGVMTVELAGRVVRTLDLRATTWQPRQVVASVAVPAGAVLQIVNTTPAGRTDRDVHVDGFLVLDGTSHSTSPAQALPAAAQARVAAPEELSVLPALAQVPASGTGIGMAVTARVYGCPSGCRIVETDDDGSAGGTERVLLDVTSPASTTLRTLSAQTRPTGDFSLRLEKAGTTVDSTTSYSPQVLPDSAFSYSDGWSLDGNRASTDGSIMRADTAGLGATYRVPGTFDGRAAGLVAARGPRGGVAGIYADGVLVRTVDLSAPAWQPRQVVAALQLPVQGRITVVNRTPAGRTASDVHVDGLVLLDEPWDFY